MRFSVVTFAYDFLRERLCETTKKKHCPIVATAHEKLDVRFHNFEHFIKWQKFRNVVFLFLSWTKVLKIWKQCECCGIEWANKQKNSRMERKIKRFFEVQLSEKHEKVFHNSKKVRIDVTFERISVDYATLRCTETFIGCTFACPISACQRRKTPRRWTSAFSFCWSLRGSMSWKYFLVVASAKKISRIFIATDVIVSRLIACR